jgi:hypothetical protein
MEINAGQKVFRNGSGLSPPVLLDLAPSQTYTH